MSDASEMSEGWNSRKGWFTLIVGPSGSGLQTVELAKTEVKFVRAMGGVLFDREGFSEDVLRIYGAIPNPKFMQFKKYRLLIPPRLCECQYTGWKPIHDHADDEARASRGK